MRLLIQGGPYLRVATIESTCTIHMYVMCLDTSTNALYHQEYIIKREGVSYSSIVHATAVVRVQTRSMIFTTCGMSLWVGA